MFAESIDTTAEFSRRDAEKKLIACRNKFLGFLRKRLNSPQDAEDVFQDFCVKVLRKHDTINGGVPLDAWLATILRNTLIDHYRRQATRSRGAQNYAIEAKIFEPAAEEVDDPVCCCVSAAIKELKPAQAALLTRVDLQEEPRDAVADELGITLNALGVRVHRTRAALKKKIAEICPICGDGRFGQCDCDCSGGVPSLLIPPDAKLAFKL